MITDRIQEKKKNTALFYQSARIYYVDIVHI